MTNARVAIVDYGVGNIFSISQACIFAGLVPEITADASRILGADAVILPGVGAFGFAMSRLHSLGLVSAIKETAQRGKPLLGICLGFQLLFDESEEMGKFKGLSLISGSIKPIANFVSDDSHKLRIPNMAWLPITAPVNQSNRLTWDSSLLNGISSGTSMYFAHSYFAEPANSIAVLAKTQYHGLNYCCATERESVFGCQFHPEKSELAGLKIYQNLAQKLQR